MKSERLINVTLHRDFLELCRVCRHLDSLDTPLAMIQSGDIDPNWTEHGATFLMAAAEQGCLQLVAALIEAGAHTRGGISAARAGKRGPVQSYLEAVHPRQGIPLE